jgi:hypothetical protein
MPVGGQFDFVSADLALTEPSAVAPDLIVNFKYPNESARIIIIRKLTVGSGVSALGMVTEPSFIELTHCQQRRPS